MKQIFAAATAAVLLTACDTMPPNYPPADPYYPAPPSQAPYPPSAGAEPCPIRGSGEWRAWINAMPGPNAQPTLNITGKVTVPTGGYTVEFTPYLQDRAGSPSDKIAQVRAIPPAGPATQAIMTHDLNWKWPVSGPISSVTIRCADKTLGHISPVQTAY